MVRFLTHVIVCSMRHYTVQCDCIRLVVFVYGCMPLEGKRDAFVSIVGSYNDMRKSIAAAHVFQVSMSLFLSTDLSLIFTHNKMRLFHNSIFFTFEFFSVMISVIVVGTKIGNVTFWS